MFEKITPEQAGVDSRAVEKYISVIQKYGVVPHSVLMMKGTSLFAEYYWAPFHKDFLHRMYSQTKSYVSIAIGLLEEEGKLSLDDTIVSHFPEKIRRELPEYLKGQTIRHMLTMCTVGGAPNWFAVPNPDRTELYLNTITAPHPAGTIWGYDSQGSQVLSSLVEKLSGMSLLDYLKSKVLDKLGTFRTARILKTRNEDSWGDSALLCTSRDMISFGRFVMNYGLWNGERLMNEKYLKDATSALVDNNEDGKVGCFTHGYGYQIWKTQKDGFAFVGMGDQLTIAIPSKDFLFTCTADDQFSPVARANIVNNLFELIIDPMEDGALAPNPAAEASLAAATAHLELAHVEGKASTAFAEKINGVTFTAAPNTTGIERFSLSIDEKGEGVFRYTNAQGDKEIPFGMLHNAFAPFPQNGYSDEHGGTVSPDGYYYDCAVSGAWREEKKLMLRGYIIDKYLGNFTFIFSFKDEALVHVRMIGNAENFLGEYNGDFMAKAN